jgi:hypothetical protein
MINNNTDAKITACFLTAIIHLLLLELNANRSYSIPGTERIRLPVGPPYNAA